MSCPIRGFWWLVTLAGCLMLLSACNSPEPVDRAESAPGHAADGPWFEDVTEVAGLDFVHNHGGSGMRYMVETMGSGGGFFDFDGDGWLDILLLQGAPLPGHPAHGDEASTALEFSTRLYRNRGDGSFEDVSAGSGLEYIGYAMGVCFGDIDNNGLVDIHVTAFGPDKLFRNRGDGTFEDISDAAGIDNPAFGASCAFADYNHNGCLDLYVVNYLDASIDNHIRCGPANLQQYCHPDAYSGVPDLLYRNRCDGSGRFDEVGAQAGIRIEDRRESKGLGVLWLDFDNDGLPDIYVANDSTRNFLFRNLGNGTFEEVGIPAGVAYNEHGRTEAGMGIAAGDFANDGQMHLFVTHLDFETNTFYRNLGDGYFVDATVATGLGIPSITRVGFGVVTLDADNSGDLDLFVANGHILDNISEHNPSLSHAQPDQLFSNSGNAVFTPVDREKAGSWFMQSEVSRGAAGGDFDNDGGMDLLVTTNHGQARLLRNRIAPEQNWVSLRLLSRHGGRDAIGARVRLVADDLERVAELRAGSSYLSQDASRLHFGLGKRESVDYIEIRWPEGDVQHVSGSEIPVRHMTTIRQPGTPGDDESGQ